MLVVEAGADLAAAQGQRGDVALQVVSVFVEEQLVVLQAAPALPPAVVGQDIKVTCRRRGQTRISPPLTSTQPKTAVSVVSPHVGTSSSADDVCSSTDGFFFPRPMIFVMVLPAPFPTVPLFCSDLELFFPFPETQAWITEGVCWIRDPGSASGSDWVD